MLHTSVDHILSDLPAARAAWFHVVTHLPGNKRCAVGWPRPEQAWHSFTRACRDAPRARVELQRRGCVIRVREATP